MRVNELRWDDPSDPSNSQFIYRHGDKRRWVVGTEGHEKFWVQVFYKDDEVGAADDINGIDLLELACVLVSYSPEPQDERTLPSPS